MGKNPQCRSVTLNTLPRSTPALNLLTSLCATHPTENQGPFFRSFPVNVFTQDLCSFLSSAGLWFFCLKDYGLFFEECPLLATEDLISVLQSF